MIAAALAVLLAALVLYFVRLVRGPSLADRVLALDGLLVCGAAAVVTHAIDTGDGSFLPVTVVFTLVGFIGTSVVARFIEGQGK